MSPALRGGCRGFRAGFGSNVRDCFRESKWWGYDIGETQVWEATPKLGDATDGRRPDDAPVRHVGERAVVESFPHDEGVAGVLPLEHCAELASGRKLGRNVLERVHDGVDAALDEALLELGGPERFSAGSTNHVQWLGKVLVAKRGHGVNEDLEFGEVGFELALDERRLHLQSGPVSLPRDSPRSLRKLTIANFEFREPKMNLGRAEAARGEGAQGTSSCDASATSRSEARSGMGWRCRRTDINRMGISV